MAGRTQSWGTRVAYRDELSNNLQFAAIYDWAGGTIPSRRGRRHVIRSPGAVLQRCNHHSLTARVTGKIPIAKTQFSASYKWIAGATVSPLDAFGEAAFQIDPNLHLSAASLFPGLNGRWEALADFSNLLAQGYVTVNGQDSRMQFVPVSAVWFRGKWS